MEADLTQAPIPIVLKLFAVYGEVIGQDSLPLTVATGTTVGNVLEQLVQDFPALAPWQTITGFGVNYQFVGVDHLVSAGDEVVLIPPVSGG